MTHAPARPAGLLLTVAMAALALTGCGAPAEPVPTDFAGGGGTTEQGAEGSGTGSTGGGGDAALAQAAADGMPGLGITACPDSDTYEFSPGAGSGRSVWHFVFTCESRDAFDATASALVADGYEADPLVISEEPNVSERNRLGADANGGFTEVQLNLVGEPGDLEFEIYVTITLP
jgi:hypothetical protein